MKPAFPTGARFIKLNMFFSIRRRDSESAAGPVEGGYAFLYCELHVVPTSAQVRGLKEVVSRDIPQYHSRFHNSDAAIRWHGVFPRVFFGWKDCVSGMESSV